jgi:lipopolysaccharide biosynthesis glycosyltransferase
MIIPVSSVVTSKTIGEFELLRTSMQEFHECEWVLSCDDESYERYNQEKNITCLNLIETDDCDHNIGSPEQKDNWMKVMMTKFDAINALIEEHGHGLFLDSDMIFVGPLEEKILSAFENKNIDACICQHMTNNWQVEAQHGLYNGGMFHIKNTDFVEQWKSLSKDYKKYGFYYEQQPLEFVQRNFVSLNLPINYNIGWWRFNSPKTRSRLELLRAEGDKIMFGKLPAVNFHVHTSRELGYQNFGQFLVDKIKDMLSQTENESHKKILKALK